MSSGETWRVLVVDDRQADEVAEIISGNKVMQLPDRIDTVTCKTFDEAIPLIEATRLDMVILDLKDDNVPEGAESFPGTRIFNEIRKRRFMPVIFHTGWPSHVDTSPNPFVKVVTRGDDPKALRKAVSEVFESHLPQFVRHLEHAQREYMWDFMEQNWTKLDVATTDLAYLLARRLAAILGRRSVREFLEQHGGASLSPDEEGLVHPVEMYVYPPLEYSCFAGDIVVCPTESSEQYWVVLTPSCDFENNKAEHILLAFCDLLANVKEFSDAAGAKNAGSTPAKRAIESLTNLLKDNHGQQDRRKFLPGTFFLPDLVVDFQNLRCVSKEKFGDWTVITSLDTPFGEALIARFARFYGRIGTPNLSVESVLNRLGIL